MQKWCRRCDKYKDVSYFGKSQHGTDKLHTYCKECNHERCRQYRDNPNHREKAKLRGKAWRINNKERWDKYYKERKSKLRLEVLQAYSKETPECACCKEKVIEFLTIDHINKNGNKHRAKIGRRGGSSFYFWLKKFGFPKGYRVLCYNCNCSIGAYGYCPHQYSDKVKTSSSVV